MENLISQTGNIAFVQDNPAFATERPYLYVLPEEAAFPITNCTFSSETPTKLHSCRQPSYENDFKKNGFAFLQSPLEHHNLEDAIGKDVPPHELIDYLQSIRDIARNYVRAQSAIVFDWRFRRAADTDKADIIEEDNIDRQNLTRPAYKAHADFSPAGGWMTMQSYLSDEEYAEVVSGRLRATVVTCWRSLVPVVIDCPLAFCARESVLDDDCVPFDRVDGSASGSQGMFLKQNDNQKWYWLPQQTSDEVSIFEGWDSMESGYKAHTFHAAFRNCEALLSTNRSFTTRFGRAILTLQVENIAYVLKVPLRLLICLDLPNWMIDAIYFSLFLLMR
ncbi:hypothetical protein F4805DRAFT_441684 [Annulohypoxylon moriforme]|nr:hypothetical protein F4805DRAFT_441684 [Annulohypoxylon moriforme]